MSSLVGGRVVFACETCGARLIKRTSRMHHKFLRHDVYQCDNPLCGATYTGHSELTGLASPSGLPLAVASELPPTQGLIRARLEQTWRYGRGCIQRDMLEELELADLQAQADSD